METILVARVESVVGSNVAVSLAERHRVIGLTSLGSFALPDCETATCAIQNPEVARQWVASVQPDQILLCPAATDSTWQTVERRPSRSECQKITRAWARAAREFNCPFTLISSDAVFTSPWMFHTEESTCLCNSPQARAVRGLEELAVDTWPSSLIVRTNAYGWSAEASTPGWIENILAELENGTAGPLDYLRHATPILATDLAEVLEAAWQKKLEGIYHVTGAERVNPNQFIERMASEFGLPGPIPVEGNSLDTRPTGFGCGETSLHTGKIREALGMAMPGVTAGLQRLREQKHNGYCDKLASGAKIGEKVA